MLPTIFELLLLSSHVCPCQGLRQRWWRGSLPALAFTLAFALISHLLQLNERLIRSLCNLYRLGLSHIDLA